MKGVMKIEDPRRPLLLQRRHVVLRFRGWPSTALALARRIRCRGLHFATLGAAQDGADQAQQHLHPHGNLEQIPQARKTDQLRGFPESEDW